MKRKADLQCLFYFSYLPFAYGYEQNKKVGN